MCAFGCCSDAALMLSTRFLCVQKRKYLSPISSIVLGGINGRNRSQYRTQCTSLRQSCRSVPTSLSLDVFDLAEWILDIKWPVDLASALLCPTQRLGPVADFVFRLQIDRLRLSRIR
jgi:hypothetical protein